jgi:hypothetical protein
MPLDIFWSLRTADLDAARAIHRLTATSSIGIRLYADSSNHSNGLFSLQVVVES